jgi:hypothetical protein
MLNDPQFASRSVSEWIDPLGVILLSTVGLVTIGFIVLMYHAHQLDNANQAFQERCLEAGGVAVIPYPGLKSKNNGQFCINPSAIIQLKEEK